MIDGQNPLISIIVPVYKVEQYLDRCVRSIISQTYKNIEVFLVDDGSPDNCGKMCDEYAEKYLCINVIHQENGGQASARNNAVKLASGEYVLFIDSDDYVTDDHVEYLVKLIFKYQADIAIGGFRYLYEGKKIPEKCDVYKEYELTPSETLIKMNYGKGFGATPWAKLIKLKLVKKYPFTEGVVYEDLDTMYKIIGDANKIVFGERIIYYWIQRNESTMRSEFSTKQLYGIEAAKHQIDYVASNHPEALSAAKARYVAKVIELMSMVLKSENSKDNYINLKNQLLYTDDFLTDERVRKSQKIRCRAIQRGFGITKLTYKIHEFLKRRLI